jgi:hypothetical protein
LLTMAKDKPFEFLDHSIRSGDSLVGLHSIDQLRHFSLKPDADDAVLFRGPLDEAVDEAIELRLRLEDLPANTVEDVQRQEQLLIEANEKIARLRCAADLLVAAEYWGENAKDKMERVRQAAVKSGYYVEKGPTEEFERVAREAWTGNREPSSRTTVHGPRTTLSPFHWPLEFPEVIVKRGGFDAFVGNPPFMGGKKITGSLGTHFRDFLVQCLANGAKGNADICAYFFLQSGRLLRTLGNIGFLATNTICQGETREVGLDQLIPQRYSVLRAVPSRPWPGTASLEVAMVWLHSGVWTAAAYLDEKTVNGISPYLKSADEVSGPPRVLKANQSKGFQGTIVLGMGFVMTPEEADSLISENADNKTVLCPYLNGEDISSRFDQSPSRWVINFGDKPLREAESYHECMRIVREKVKPERDALKDKGYREKWWQFGRRAVELYQAIDGMSQVLAMCKVSKYLNMVFVPATLVYSNRLTIFAYDCPSDFAVLQSNIHEPWAREYSATLETRLSYTPTDCFETFPFPVSKQGMRSVGQTYHEHRERLMRDRHEGLTDLYNRFHDPSEPSADIQTLRDLHVEMDQAVAAAYGWTDLALSHGCHETKQGIRFTISELARREVLQRLLKLNHERYAEEVKQGLHGTKGGAKKVAAKKKAARNPAKPESSLFDLGEDDE